MRKEWLVLCLVIPLFFGCERREAEAPVVVKEPPAVVVPPAPTVKNLAGATLSDLGAQPLYFRLARIVLPAGKLAQYGVGDSMIYQLSGTTEIAAGETTRKLGSGEGMYVPAGSLTSYLAAAESDAVYLQFMLTPPEDLGRSLTAGRDIQAEDIFVSAEPLPALTDGTYRFELIRMQYPPGATTSPTDERTAAGLYYVTKGKGAFSGGETPETVETGAAVLAPVAMGGAWNNPGQDPLEVVFTSLVPAGNAPAAETGK